MMFLVKILVLTCSILGGVVSTCAISVNSSLRFESEIDSTRFWSIQNKLVGCWENNVYQFRYRKDSNVGGEYRSIVRSSAPLFKLTLKNNEVYLEWIELTGGVNLSRVLSISKRKLIVITEEGSRIIYKRNKTCE